MEELKASIPKEMWNYTLKGVAEHIEKFDYDLAIGLFNVYLKE